MKCIHQLSQQVSFLKLNILCGKDHLHQHERRNSSMRIRTQNIDGHF